VATAKGKCTDDKNIAGCCFRYIEPAVDICMIILLKHISKARSMKKEEKIFIMCQISLFMRKKETGRIIETPVYR